MPLVAGHQQLQLKQGSVEVKLLQPKVPSDTAIILLHEGLGAISMWRFFPEQLSAVTGYQIIMYSRFGYGNSSICEIPRRLDYMEQEALGPLPELIEHIDARQFILLGHSDGASIASVYAGSNHDTRLRALILIAPHFFTEQKAITAIEQAKAAYVGGDLRQRLERHHGANVDTAFFGWNDTWLHPDFRNWDITQYLASITIPTLLIQGSEDEYGTEAQIDVAEKQIPARLETHLMTGLKHSPHFDKPDAIIGVITGFCKQTRSQDR